MPDSLCNDANLKRPLGSLLMINWTLASQKWQSPSNKMIFSIFSLTLYRHFHYTIYIRRPLQRFSNRFVQSVGFRLRCKAINNLSLTIDEKLCKVPFNFTTKKAFGLFC